jgi:hypothetical protein
MADIQNIRCVRSMEWQTQRIFAGVVRYDNGREIRQPQQKPSGCVDSVCVLFVMASRVPTLVSHASDLVSHASALVSHASAEVVNINININIYIYSADRVLTSKTVISTGMTWPAWSAVRALYSLQNAMMFTP